METLSGLIPNLSILEQSHSQPPHIIIAAMVGTTVFSGLFIIRTTLVKSAGWKISDLHKTTKRCGLLRFSYVCYQCSNHGIDGCNIIREWNIVREIITNDGPS